MPGGGKTTHLLNLYRNIEGTKMLCVTSNETRNQILKKDPQCVVAILNNIITANVEHLLIDEYIMHAPGNILRVLTR